MLLTSKDAVIQHGVCAASSETQSTRGVGELDKQQTPPRSPNAQLLLTVILLKPDRMSPASSSIARKWFQTHRTLFPEQARQGWRVGQQLHALFSLYSKGSPCLAVALASRRVYMIKAMLDSLLQEPSEGVQFT